MARAQNNAVNVCLLSAEERGEPFLVELVDQPGLLLVFEAEVAVLLSLLLSHELAMAHQNEHSRV